MKVEDANLTAAASTARPQAYAPVDTAGGPRTEAARSGAGDRVELSGTADRLGTVLAAQHEARARRVEALRQDFQSGRLAVNAYETSRGLVSETLRATADEPAARSAK
jgi:anti-sigma28 factor (negative regulator of flagellin synthesis)